MKQSEAVIKAVQEVIPTFELNSDVGLDCVVGEDRKAVCAIVVEGIINGDVDYKKDNTDEKKVKEYVPGMVSNWLRKSPKLNGGTKYEIKNKGSRAGQGDAELKALKQLRKTTTDEETLKEIDGHIERRTNEIAAEKAKKVEVNFDALPEELRAKLGV